MSRIIPKNRDPRINEFGPDDLVLNTTTGDLFAKANNRLFKIIGRNQFDQSTTDQILNLLTTSTDSNTTGSAFSGFNTVGGFYGIVTTSPLTGSNVSLHGGVPFDYGQPLPNSPYIKTNGGFDILMDNPGVYENSSFRVFKDTGIAGVGGSELLKLDNEGNLTVSGSILTSESGGNVSGSLSINGNLIVSGTSALNGDITIPKSVKIYFADVSGMHIYSEGTATDENQIILAKTNNLRILNQAHGKDIEFGTENASGTAKTPLILSGSGDSTFGGNVTVAGNIVSTGDITAQRYVVSSSVTNLVTQTLSGSTAFGDSADDTHQFVGHITASGNISSSGNIVAGTIVAEQISSTDDMFAVDKITAGGVISSSAGLIGETLTIGGATVVQRSDDGTTIRFGSSGDITKVLIGKAGVNESIELIGNITASGNISASGKIYSGEFYGEGDPSAIGSRVIEATSTEHNFGSAARITKMLGTAITLNAPVTASGNISSSGTITAAAAVLTTADINGGTIDGITSLTAGGNLDIGTHELRASTFQSDVSTGTAPFTVASTTEVTNLHADTATTFHTARTINGESFDGSANITVTAAGSTLSDTVTVAKGGTGATSFADKSVIITQDSGTDTLAAVAMSTNGQLLIGGTSGPAVAVPTGGDGLTVTVGDGTLEYDLDAALTTVTSVVNSSLEIGRDADNRIKFGTDNQIIFEVSGGDNVIFKASGEIEASSLDISGDVDVDGTMEADAITVNGTALNTVIAGVTVTNATTAAVATTVTVTANEDTDENNVILFAAGADTDGGNLGVESDSGLKYNPSTTLITCKGVHSTAGNTISSAGATTLDAASFVSLDAGNGDIYFKDHSVTKLHLDMDGTNSLIFQLKTNGDSLIFRQFDGKDVLHIDDTGYVGIKNGDTSAGELRIFEDSDDGTNYVGLTVAAMAGSQTYTLPTADGSDGQVLKTNGSGVLDWVDSSSSSGDITSVVAGTGLTGGATTGDATLNVIGGDGITANANDIAITAAQTTITSILATDIKIGEDDQTKIDFETADEIHFYAANVEQVYLADNIFGPQSDSDVDLGTTGVRWKDAYVDSITITGEVDAATGDFSGNVDIAGDLTLSAGGDGALTFGAASSIKIVDNSSTALVIEEANTAYMTFLTTNSSEIVRVHKPFQMLDAVQVDGTLSVGLDDTGHDVKFYGATSGRLLHWDESANKLILTGATLNVDTNGLFQLAGTAVTSTAAELNILDGVTSTTAELNILDGVTSTAAELNILDGVTSTAAELNVLDGITAVVGELNALDIGSTAVGTAVASKAVILDSNKDYTGIRNLTVSGELDAATGDFSGDVDIAGTTNLDVVDIDGNVQLDGTLTIGLDDVGYNVRIFGATSTKQLNWVAATDTLKFNDSTILGFGTKTSINNQDSSIQFDGTNLIIDSDTDIVIDAAGGNIEFKDAGTLQLTLDMDGTAGAQVITLGVDEDNLIFKAHGGGTILTLDDDTSVTAAAAFTAGGIITGTGFTAGNAVIAEAELELLDGLTAGTAIASKVVTTDANIDTTGQRNLTITGELDAATGDFSGAVDIAGDLTLSAGADGALTFGAASSIKIVDNQASSLVIEEADTAYMTFTTTNSSELITANKGFNIAGAFQIGGTAVTSTAAELNILDGVTSTAAELNILDGVTSTAAELNILDGVTSTAAELNFLDAVARGKIIYGNASGATALLSPGGANQVLTSDGTDISWADAASGGAVAADDVGAGDAAVTITTTSGDITIDAAANNSDIIFKGTDGGADTTFLTIDGSDAGAAAFNDKVTIGDGKLILNSTAVTSTAAELNILDGVTSTATELNFLDGSSANSVVNSKAVIYGSSGELAGTLSTAAQANVTSVGTLSALTVSGDINANGNIVGDDSTNITNIATIECDILTHDGDTDTKLTFGTDSIRFTAGNNVATTFSSTLIINNLPLVNKFSVPGSSGVGMGTAGAFDNSGGGDIVYIGGGSTTLGKVYYYKSDGEWGLTDADAASTATGWLAVALGTDPDVHGMLLRGMVTLAGDIVGTEALGSILYLDTATTGDVTTVAPSGTNDIVRVVGYAVSTGNDNKIWFDPSKDWVEHA